MPQPMGRDIQELLRQYPSSEDLGAANPNLPQDEFSRLGNLGNLLSMLTQGGGFKDAEPVRDIEHLRGVVDKYGQRGREESLGKMQEMLADMQELRAAKPAPEAAGAPYQKSLKNDDLADIIARLMKGEDPGMVSYR